MTSQLTRNYSKTSAPRLECNADWPHDVVLSTSVSNPRTHPGVGNMVLTHPNQLLYRLAQSRSAHPTYLTEETGPILSHSRSWHMDWNPAHSGFWPKVCGCCSCRKRKLTTEEWAQWELVNHMRSTCFGIFLFLGGGAHLHATPPTQPRPITPQRVEK